MCHEFTRIIYRIRCIKLRSIALGQGFLALLLQVGLLFGVDGALAIAVGGLFESAGTGLALLVGGNIFLLARLVAGILILIHKCLFYTIEKSGPKMDGVV